MTGMIVIFSGNRGELLIYCRTNRASSSVLFGPKARIFLFRSENRGRDLSIISLLEFWDLSYLNILLIQIQMLMVNHFNDGGFMLNVFCWLKLMINKINEYYLKLRFSQENIIFIDWKRAFIGHWTISYNIYVTEIITTKWPLINCGFFLQTCFFT